MSHPDSSSAAPSVESLRQQWKTRGEAHEDAEGSAIPSDPEAAWDDGVHHGAAGAYAVAVSELEPLVDHERSLVARYEALAEATTPNWRELGPEVTLNLARCNKQDADAMDEADGDVEQAQIQRLTAQRSRTIALMLRLSQVLGVTPDEDGTSFEAVILDRMHTIQRLTDALQTVVTTFERDEQQGYRSRDRRYAIDVLKAVLPETPHEKSQP